MFQLMEETQQEGEARWGRYSGCYGVEEIKVGSWKRQVLVCVIIKAGRDGERKHRGA